MSGGPSTGWRGLLGLLLSGVLPAAGGGGPGHEFPFPTYEQELVIEFRDTESAAKAELSVADLPNGAHRAVSCRWDDNVSSANEETRAMMEQHGIRGTFYLNSRHFSPANAEVDYLATARRLLPGGNSIGGHSLTHPFITYYHPNRMFEEMAGVRIEWEANLDVPVVSYAYSFIDLLPGPRGTAAQAETVRSLERAGYYHVAENLDLLKGLEPGLEISPIMPPENQSDDSFRQAVEWAYQDREVIPAHPMISNSMHAWYGTPLLDKGFDALKWRLELLAGLEGVWHCNQNEYAAYRRQVRASKLSTVGRKGRFLTVRLERPDLIDLGEATPLTLEVTGVAPGAVRAVQCDGDPVRLPARTLPDQTLLPLAHAPGRDLPKRIGWLPNPDNRTEVRASDEDRDFPGLGGLLSGSTNELRLIGRSAKALEDVRVTWRMPLGWREGVVRQNKAAVPAGTDWSWTLPVTRDEVGRPGAGQPYFVAQVDFRIAGERGRIHFTCRLPAPGLDDRWPRDRFALLGPFEEGEFDEAAFEAAVRAAGTPDNWTTTTGRTLSWRPDARDGYVRQDWLDPEYVRTMGTWDPRSPGYVLRSSIHSPDERRFELFASEDHVSRFYVNGALSEGWTGLLRKGWNELIIVYRPQVLNRSDRRLAACFVRLCRPGTRERMTDLRFRP